MNKRQVIKYYDKILFGQTYYCDSFDWKKYRRLKNELKQSVKLDKLRSKNMKIESNRFKEFNNDEIAVLKSVFASWYINFGQSENISDEYTLILNKLLIELDDKKIDNDLN